MYNLSVSDIDSNMSAVTYKIAGLCIFKSAHIHAYISVCCGGMRKRYAKVLIYAHNKSGAVSAVCKACPAIYIRIANKLNSIVNYCIAASMIGYRCC